MEEFLKKLQEIYGRHIAAIFCLTTIYKDLQSGDRSDETVWEIEDCYEYFIKHLASEVLNKGSNVLRLHQDVAKEMKKL